MRLIAFVLWCSMLLACNRKPDEKHVYDQILDAEIATRVELLEASESNNLNKDSFPNAKEIQTAINDLILLTKDVENSDAVIQKANHYFKNASERYKIPYEGFVVVLKTMSLPTIETTIKTNQLNMLDKIIFLKASLTNDSIMMSSVY